MTCSVTQSVRRILRPWLLASLASSIIAGQALAADQGSADTTPTPDQSSDSTGLQEVIVTAQFRRQNVQDTPIAITAISAASLAAHGDVNLVDVSNQAPDVNLRETGGAFGPGMSASIRGIGQADFDPALEPGVGIYIDDVYYPSLTGANFDLLDLIGSRSCADLRACWADEIPRAAPSSCIPRSRMATTADHFKPPMVPGTSWSCAAQPT